MRGAILLFGGMAIAVAIAFKVSPATDATSTAAASSDPGGDFGGGGHGGSGGAIGTGPRNTIFDFVGPAPLVQTSGGPTGGVVCAIRSGVTGKCIAIKPKPSS